MKIHFKPNLKHQSEAIAATVRVFEGAPYTRAEELWNGTRGAKLDEDGGRKRQKACAHEYDNRVADAGDEWQKIFGTYIPRVL